MLDYIKVFCGIPSAVTIYDEQLTMFRKIAIAKLEKAGIKPQETSDLVRDFIATYCRLEIVTEPSEQWRNSEQKRLNSLFELMFYGGI